MLARLIGDLPDPQALLDARRGEREPPLEPYAALVRAIVGQQLSVAAARSVWTRLLAQFGGTPPSPDELLAADLDELRGAAGLSRAKARSLHSLAEHVLDGSLELDRIDELDDATAEAELVAVKGIGPWTAHMFLMFHLDRPDILAPGDLGIRKAISIAYDMDELPTPEQVTEMAERWRPWRTIACRLLWRSLDAPAPV